MNSKYSEMTVAQVMNIPLDDIRMSTRLRNCLESRGWTHVRDVAEAPYSSIYCIRNLGTGTMRELEKLLDKMGVGIGLLYNDHKNRRLWRRMTKHSALAKLSEKDCFKLFCDLVQPRTR